MNGRNRFHRGLFLTLLMVSISLMFGAPLVSAGGVTGSGCTDCHKAGRRSSGAGSGRSGMVHIGGVSPHRAPGPAAPSSRGSGTGQTPGPAAPTTGGAPKR